MDLQTALRTWCICNGFKVESNAAVKPAVPVPTAAIWLKVVGTRRGNATVIRPNGARRKLPKAWVENVPRLKLSLVQMPCNTAAPIC